MKLFKVRILVGAFEEKCPTLTVGSFFYSFNNNNLNYGRSKHTRNVKSSSKTKKHVQNLENILRILPLAILAFFTRNFFGTTRLFGISGLHERGPLQFCNRMDVEKTQRVPRFTFFGTVTLSNISIFVFFFKIF